MTTPQHTIHHRDTIAARRIVRDPQAPRVRESLFRFPGALRSRRNPY